MLDIIDDDRGHITIKLTRGDYARITVTTDDKETGQPHIFVDGEQVKFILKGPYNKVEKNCTINIGESTCILELEDEDTFDFEFGKYKYEFEYTNVAGKPDTFIAAQDFYITEEQEDHNGR